MMKKEYQRPETKAYETEIHRMLAMSEQYQLRNQTPDDDNEDIW